MLEQINEFIGILPHSQQFIIPIIYILLILLLLFCILRMIGVKL